MGLKFYHFESQLISFSLVSNDVGLDIINTLNFIHFINEPAFKCSHYPIIMVCYLSKSHFEIQFRESKSFYRF